MEDSTLAELSTTDQTILSTLNYHICRSEFVTVSTLADECSVCKSTVVKMAKKLGYSGFADMRDTLSVGRADEVSETFLPLDTAEDGDILLFHDSHGTTVEGVLDALPTLVARGFTFVTVSDLFRLRGYSLSSGSVYYSAP